MESTTEAYLTAGKSVVETLKDRDLGGGFRKACIASIDYLRQSTNGGKPLDSVERKTISRVLKMGTIINDYYDLGQLDPEQYKELRRDFQEHLPEREVDYLKYRRLLSDYERLRPNPNQLADSQDREESIVRYREDVNRLSLAMVFSVALDKPLDEFINKEKSRNYPFFEPFYNLTMAMQVVDDLMGADGDLKYNRPSFYTAVCSKDELTNRNPNSDKSTHDKVIKYFRNYVDRSNSEKLVYMKPLTFAVKATEKIYPTLFKTVQSGNMPKNIAGLEIVTERDAKKL